MMDPPPAACMCGKAWLDAKQRGAQMQMHHVVESVRLNLFNRIVRFSPTLHY